MGTNYYARPEPCPKPCRHCRPEELHIGKSSGGWKFGFQGHPEYDPPLTSWAAWRDFLARCEIVDEYGQALTLDEFTRVVTDRWTPRDMDRPICRVEPTADEIARGFGGRHYPDERRYHDPEGFDFYDGEFS